MHNKIIAVNKITVTEEQVLKVDDSGNLVAIIPKSKRELGGTFAAALCVLVNKDTGKIVLFSRGTKSADMHSKFALLSGNMSAEDIENEVTGQKITDQSAANTMTREIKEEADLDISHDRLTMIDQFYMKKNEKKGLYFFLFKLDINTAELEKIKSNGEIGETKEYSFEEFATADDIGDALKFKRDAFLDVLKESETNYHKYGPIRIKGLYPTRIYPETIHFRTIFDQTPSLAPNEVDSELQSLGIPLSLNALYQHRNWLSESTLNTIGYHKQRAMPFSMSDAPNVLQFNLRWQDSFIKANTENSSLPISDDKITNIFRAFSMVLKSKDATGEPMYKSMNNTEFTKVGTQFIKSVFKGSPSSKQPDGKQINKLPMEILKSGKLKSLADIVKASVYSGTTFWFKPEQLANPTKTEADFWNSMQTPLTIDHINRVEQIANTSNNLAYIVDDNGEIAFDLALIKHLMDNNPNLNITIWTNKTSIFPNTSEADIKDLLKDDYFSSISNSDRLQINSAHSILPNIDMRFESPELIETIDKSDAVIIKGASYFEAIPTLNKERFYLFTVYQPTIQKLTGLEAGSGVFLNLPAMTPAFDDIDDNGIARIRNAKP